MQKACCSGVIHPRTTEASLLQAVYKLFQLLGERHPCHNEQQHNIKQLLPVEVALPEVLVAHNGGNDTALHMVSGQG
jgi:hypothetical protein